MSSVVDILNLQSYPLHEPNSNAYLELVARCTAALAADGLFNLPGFVHAEAVSQLVAPIAQAMPVQAFTHSRSHNIYFADEIAGLAPEHPALAKVTTTNHTLCADQLQDNPLISLYEYPPLAAFLTDVLGQQQHLMADPLARINVVAYRHDEALNWHFDRTYATTTLLLQNAERGGEFQYRRALRTPDNPNYDGVARLINGDDDEVHTLAFEPGTLNVFLGENTAHRTTQVCGAKERLIAVFSYYDKPGVEFSDAERIGFYGRRG